MTPLLRAFSLTALASLWAVLAQEPGIERGWPFSMGQSNFTGTWKLNREKSKYGNLRKPVSVIVTIDHRNPTFSYSGSVVDADGDLRNFEFSGAIDGKQYPASRSYGQGTIVLRWTSSNTFTEVFTSADGRWVETITRSLSRNGRTLTQRTQIRGPDGQVTWTEVYDKL